jgi:hypothetical protein
MMTEGLILPDFTLKLRDEWKCPRICTSLVFFIFKTPLHSEASTSETSVNFYQTTRRNIPEDSHLHTHRREKLKFPFHSFKNDCVTTHWTRTKHCYCIAAEDIKRDRKQQLSLVGSNRTWMNLANMLKRLIFFRRSSKPNVKQMGSSATARNCLCEGLCFQGELIYFPPALCLPIHSSTFPYKLSLQLLSAEFALLHVSRTRKLRSETQRERGNRVTLIPHTTAKSVVIANQ